MDAQHDSKLCKDFPNLFADRGASPRVSNMCWGFPGTGWYKIIRAAAEKLEPLIVAYKLEHPGEDAPRASQIKEKFGTLRFYLSHGTDEMFKIADEAERKSATICEECGDTGKLRKGGWLRTLCDGCQAARVKERA